MQKQIIKLQKSIIPSCDVGSLKKLKKIAENTCHVEGVGAYKIGLELVIPHGIKKIIDSIRDITNLPIIYDHQKAGSDIPELGEKFVKACKGVDAIIIFPHAGPETEKAWIKAAQKEEMPVIVGGEMTHKSYLSKDGGFINDNAPKKIYEVASSMGVKDFVVPGNKPDKAIEYKKIIEKNIKNPAFYSPGLIVQGGKISELAKKLDCWHAIIGRAIYEAKDINKAAKEFVKQLAR